MLCVDDAPHPWPPRTSGPSYLCTSANESRAFVITLPSATTCLAYRRTLLAQSQPSLTRWVSTAGIWGVGAGTAALLVSPFAFPFCAPIALEPLSTSTFDRALPCPAAVSSYHFTLPAPTLSAPFLPTQRTFRRKRDYPRFVPPPTCQSEHHLYPHYFFSLSLYLSSFNTFHSRS